MESLQEPTKFLGYKYQNLYLSSHTQHDNAGWQVVKISVWISGKKY